jgi:ubiquinol-cytochrome c reductase cytochrome b subunit
MYYSPSPDHAYESIKYLDGTVTSGAVIRGIHHWGASAMVVLCVAHMIRVFTMGAYKYPREANWLLGVALLFVVLGFGFTGYLLPWDQKAYWATAVGTNIAGTTPIIGAKLVALLRGGSQQGAATLTRFYALHVLLLPVLLSTIVGLHLVLVVRQGVAPRAAELEADAPAKTSDAAYPEYYKRRLKESKGRGNYRFWPDIIGKDVIVATLVILLLVALGTFVGAPLEGPADPTDSAYVPRPEWYFLPFFQLLKLVPGSWESAVAMGLPMALVLVLLLLPFFDRRSARSIVRRPGAAFGLGGIAISTAILLGASMNEEPAAVKAPEVGRVLTSSERAGRTQFERQQCAGCHKVAGMVAPKKEDAPEAPELTEIGLKHSTAWMHSFIEEPTRFHPDSKMPAYGPPTLSHQEIEELARYLGSLRGPPGLKRQPDFRDTFPEPVKAKENQ